MSSEHAESLAHDGSDQRGEETSGRNSSAFSLGLLLLAAVALAVAPHLLPHYPEYFNPTDRDLWIRFGQDVLFSTMRLLAVVAVAIVVSAFVPQIGLAVDRFVLRSRRRTFLLAVAAFSVVSSALFSWFILDALPHIPDELAMLFQAKILATGKLYAHAPPLPTFFDWESIIVQDGRWYGKYFIAQSLFFVPGIWLGAPWLVHPLMAAAAIWLTFLLAVELFNEKIARVAVLVMALSPFRTVIFALYLTHPVTMLAIALFVLGVLKVIKDPTRWGWSLTAGVGFGLAWNSRPLTLAAMTLPLFVMTLTRLRWRRLRWQTVTVFVVTIAVFFGIYLGYNKVLTGNAMKPPFEVWSKTDRLGFGPDRGLEYWREEDKGHTFAKGLFHDVYFNMEALAAQLTGWGLGAILLLVIPLVYAPFRRSMWLMAAMVGCLIFAYVFHVTHSVLAGQPRYWSEAMPMMMILVALGLLAVRRVLPRLCRWLEIPAATRTGRAAGWLALVVLTLVGHSVYAYEAISGRHNKLWEQGADVRRALAEQPLDNALVFVRAHGFYRTMCKTRVLDLYPCGFMLNDPDLAGLAIFARDLGPEMNARLIAKFPSRKLYWIDPKLGEAARFVPYEQVKTMPQAWELPPGVPVPTTPTGESGP